MGAVDIDDLKTAIGAIVDAKCDELLDNLQASIKAGSDITDLDAENYPGTVLTYDDDEGWTVDDGSDWDDALAAAFKAGRDATLAEVEAAIEAAKNK
jgi:hypothetical protein